MKNNPKITPMLRQYLEIKESYNDAVLFYRMGDFYEMFFDDAVLASKILGITLTSRSHKDEENKVPMCGIPYHALAGYLGKMIKAGHRVAICEQVGDPRKSKGIVKREVVRIVSPGVTTDEQILDEKSNCYVCALAFSSSSAAKQLIGISFLDASTGNFQVCEIETRPGEYSDVIDLLTRMVPSELLLSAKETDQQAELVTQISALMGDICTTSRPDEQFAKNEAATILRDHFQTTSLAGFGCDHFSLGISAAGALLAYIQETQKASLSHIQRLTPLNHKGFLVVDDASRRNLELTETAIGGKREGSLLSVLDFTATSMGARMLRERILFPLQDKAHINLRLDALEEIIQAPVQQKETIKKQLDAVYDLERLCSRLVMGQGNARDMVAIKLSLQQLPQLKEVLHTFTSVLITDIDANLDELHDLCSLIETSIRDDAPVTLREGKLIKDGYNQELDNLLSLLRNDKQHILSLEAREKERTGISKLKVGYNKVFGYFIEISRSQTGELPDDYIRKQTLVNAERFITEELKELENSITSAQEQRLELEYNLFLNIRTTLARQSSRILETAHNIARIDFLFSLAQAAIKYRYAKPVLNDQQRISIAEGRHPVIELSLDSGRFVPNDVILDQDENQLIIITGPNMAGKSTVLRQTALIVLMAHIGSFVPAKKADICLVDRIFTRVGAMDDLRRGQSTFMVEMNETANILNNATPDSLVILDEIGRGTSTYDGLAIAWAVSEDLVEKQGQGVKTLFATHYHELTDLATQNRRIQNFSIAVREWNDSIIFLHKLVKGATNRSYGIQVAALAGVPNHVTKRAYKILTEIEQGNVHHSKQSEIDKTAPSQLPLFPPREQPFVSLVQSLQLDDITPRQALDILYELHQMVKKQGF